MVPIHSRRTVSTAFKSLILLSALLLSAAASAAPCADVFERLYPEGSSPTVRKLLGEPDSDITYGLEAEFNLKKAPGVLEWYRPTSFTDEQWSAMSLEQKKSHVSVDGRGLVKTKRAPEWLLGALESDPGGAELITRPTDKLETAMKWVETVEKAAGGDGKGRSKAFYWQGNVAYKRGGKFSRTQRDGMDGYLRATADYAQLGKLANGYKHHLKNRSFIPGKNLHHFVLGPMNQEVKGWLDAELEAASQSRSSNPTAKNHYVQGTFFRTWSYGSDRNGFEVRDAHKDVRLLKQEMRRLTHGLQKGFTGYKQFKNVAVLNDTADFAKFSDPVKQMLRSGVLHMLPDGTSGDVYPERYALPMRAYESFYPRALGLSGKKLRAFSNKVVKARQVYVQTLETIAADRGLDGYARRDRVHIALGRFAHDSGIYQHLDHHFGKIGQAP